MTEAFSASPNARQSERGSSSIKFIVVLAVVALVAYMGFQMVPVWYQSSNFKGAMDKSSEDTAELGKPKDWLESQIKANASEYCKPPCSFAILNPPAIRDGRWEVTVAVKRPVNLLPFWTYNYDFEYTTRSRTSVNP